MAPLLNPRLPAEWELQSGVQLTWPHAGTDWAQDLAVVEPVFAQIGAAISRRESLLVVCPTRDAVDRVRATLEACGARQPHLRFAITASDDSWARDHGAITVLTAQGPRLLDFHFNGWGGKFAAGQDNRITQSLHAAGVFGATPCLDQGFVLEGGAIETDGEGTLLATRHSVVTETRNPGLDIADVEALLTERLGIQRFLWLDHGSLSGDDTDGHIDTLARFAGPDTILYVTAEPEDPDYPELAAMAKELTLLRNGKGNAYHLVPLPPPGIHRDGDGRRLPASYANFLVINGAVLLPVYGVANDQLAIGVLADAFPGRDIMPIDCRPIIAQNGSLHCLTMQFPADVPLHDGVTDRTPSP
jgi:agmatine/peptidylarginine deiminase